MIDLVPGRRLVRGFTTAALLSVVLSAPVPAQVAGPCADDLAKHCSGITPGGGRLKQCLEKHSDDISPACRD